MLMFFRAFVWRLGGNGASIWGRFELPGQNKKHEMSLFFTANKELRSSGEASFGGADWAPFGSPFGVPLEAPGHYDHPRIPRAYHAHTVRIPNPPRGWGWGGDGGE